MQQELLGEVTVEISFLKYQAGHALASTLLRTRLRSKFTKGSHALQGSLGFLDAQTRVLVPLSGSL